MQEDTAACVFGSKFAQGHTAAQTDAEAPSPVRSAKFFRSTEKALSMTQVPFHCIQVLSFCNHTVFLKKIVLFLIYRLHI